ncbi:aldehyde dehydrogenase family protein [Streptomyces canus]|uniref:aldehyde dehydrogenase family protein n=1 Tax=Streptomyces canus TaxID=58343 RepID=UPI00371CA8D8
MPRAIDKDLLERLSSQISGDRGPFDISTPFTGRTLASVPLSRTDDVTRAYDRARAAQRSWAALSPAERAKPFLAFFDQLMAGQPELLDILQLETGKARRHAHEEVLDVALCTLYYARRAPKWLRDHRRGGAMPFATRVREARRPKGVVGMITPWNYPISMGVTHSRKWRTGSPTTRWRAVGPAEGAQTLHGRRHDRRGTVRGRHHAPGHDVLPLVWIILLISIGGAIAFAAWMAAFTETVEKHNPAATATGLAVWGATLRTVVVVMLFGLIATIPSASILVDHGPGSPPWSRASPRT